MILKRGNTYVTSRRSLRHSSCPTAAQQALEADGARRLRNESFFSAPQLKRDPLGSTEAVDTGERSQRGIKPEAQEDLRARDSGYRCAQLVLHSLSLLRLQRPDAERTSAADRSDLSGLSQRGDTLYHEDRATPLLRDAVHLLR